MIAELVLSLTVPPNTLAAAPARIQAMASLPALAGGTLVIPKGSAGLVGARVLTRGTPVYPNGGNWVTGDGERIPFDCGLQMFGPPYLIDLEGYNQDDTWPHTIELRIRTVTYATR